MADGAPRYTREEMDAILKRALDRQQVREQGIAHDELVAAAIEVGIPREEVEAAAREVERERRAAQGTVELASETRARRARDVRKFFRGALVWAIFSVFFYAMSAVTGGSWWVFPVLGWGLAVALQGVRVLFPGEPRESRRERRARRRAEKLRDFERRVDVGADALVRVIEEARRAKRAPDEPPRIVRVDTREADVVTRDEREDAAHESSPAKRRS